MQVDPKFMQLVETLYEGPMEERPWQSFLRLVREVLSADVSVIFLRPPQEESRLMMLVDGGRSEGIANYEAGLFTLDPFVDLPSGAVVTLREVIPEAELLASDFYRLSMEPSGLTDFIGADLAMEGEFRARFRLSRYAGREQFNEDDKYICQLLMPHLERALRIHARLNKIESERDLYAGAVEQLAVGTIILDEEGRILKSNPTAATLLDEGDGLSTREGKLHLGTRQSTSELQGIITQVLANQKKAVPSVIEALQVQRPSGAPDLGLIVRPVPMNQWSEGTGVPCVAIFISDPQQQSEASADILMRLFGFTPTEANLALLLANGLTLDEAAQEMNVSRNTVRTHLRSVFGKTGVSRQTMLVRLILRSVAPLAAGDAN